MAVKVKAFLLVRRADLLLCRLSFADLPDKWECLLGRRDSRAPANLGG